MREVLLVLSMCFALSACVTQPGASGAASNTQVLSGDMDKMLREKNCTACHVWDRKLVGPALREVRSRYSASDQAGLVAKVRNGGRGSWGPIPMPPNTQINQAEAEYLVAGILGASLGVRPSPSPRPPAPLPVLADDPPSVGRVFR